MSFSNFLFGTPEKFEQRSTLLPEQQSLFAQLLRAIQGQGAGGGFGEAADYYRSLLSENPADLQAMIAPEMRRFQEDIVPSLAEQFAGMGSGAINSSGFQQSLGRAGSDLSERIAAIRASLRQSAAQGLSGLAGQGLGQFAQNIYRPREPGLFEQLSPAIGVGIGALAGGPLGAISGRLAQPFMKQKGSTSPYGER